LKERSSQCDIEVIAEILQERGYHHQVYLSTTNSNVPEFASTISSPETVPQLDYQANPELGVRR
jgi:hypothetical protein